MEVARPMEQQIPLRPWVGNIHDLIMPTGTWSPCGHIDFSMSVCMYVCMYVRMYVG